MYRNMRLVHAAASLACTGMRRSSSALWDGGFSRALCELYITPSTVKAHLASLMRKLGARNRVEVAMWLTRPAAFDVAKAPAAVGTAARRRPALEPRRKRKDDARMPAKLRTLWISAPGEEPACVAVKQRSVEPLTLYMYLRTSVSTSGC